MQYGKEILTETRNHNGIPKFVEKGTQLCLGDSVVSLRENGGVLLYWFGMVI